MRHLIAFLIILPSIALAKNELTFDGFVDMYYAYDFNNPQNGDRDYTTQPARSDEFNINLALLGVTHKVNKLTTRLSFQAGTYVQSNYAAEPSVGNTSGPSLSRNIQDAFVKYQLTDKSSVIAGIMPSHVGYESVFSIDNYTYSRSLAADYSPYYQSGVGLIHQLNPSWTFEGYVLNGWQNISEDDTRKSLGTAIRYNKDKWSVNYTTYLGSYLERSRHFHDINIEYRLSESVRLKTLYNFGVQDQADNKEAYFSTFNIQAHWQMNPLHALSLRFETYHDTEQANITTNTDQAFNVSGGSLGYDYAIEEGYLLRAEYRYFKGSEKIYKKQDSFEDTNQNFVISLATRF